MKRLSIAQEYTDKNGEVKTKWYDAGVIIKKQNGKEVVILDNGVNFNNFSKDGRVFLNVTEPKDDSKSPSSSDDAPF